MSHASGMGVPITLPVGFVAEGKLCEEGCSEPIPLEDGLEDNC